MQNTLLISQKLIESEQITELRRHGHRVKILHLFEPEPDRASLELVNHLDWVEKVIIEDDIYRACHRVFSTDAERLGRYVYTNPPPQMQALCDNETPGSVLFVPCNETHVKMMLPVAAKLPRARFLVIRGENADRYLDAHRTPFERMALSEFYTPAYRPKLIELFLAQETSVIVFGNDWVGENWRICQLARRVGLPTICIEEGPQDFDLEDGRHEQMCHADYVFLQGLKTLDFLEAQQFYVSGNPRLGVYQPLPLPAAPVVMLNSNFTYGVFEEARDQWIADCVTACGNAGADYFISKHPRDRGDLRRYKVIDSDAFKLPDQLAQCGVVITRFSQVVHEAMLSGRQVIYYNPHGEKKPLQTEDRSGGYFHASNPTELAQVLKIALKTDFPNKKERDLCNRLHCGPCDGKEVTRCVWGICQVAHQHPQGYELLVRTPPRLRELMRRVRCRLKR